MVSLWLPVCPSICLSYVCLSVFLFPDDNFSKCQWIFTKLSECIDIVEIWFVIVNGQIWSIFAELSAYNTSLFSFLDDNFSKYQWVLTKFGVCINIVEIWFGIDDGQISSFFDSYLPATSPYFHFWMKTLVNVSGFSPNLVCALILLRSALGFLIGKFCPF